MKDAKVTQTEAKDQNGFLSSLHSLISSITSENNPREQDYGHIRTYLLCFIDK